MFLHPDVFCVSKNTRVRVEPGQEQLSAAVPLAAFVGL